jgi:hypothetical protein
MSEKRSLVENICIENTRCPWCTGKIRQDTTILFRKEGLEINTLYESDHSNNSRGSTIVDRVCTKLDCEIQKLLRQTESTTHEAHVDVLRALVEQKTSMMCFAKALRGKLSQEGGK